MLRMLGGKKQQQWRILLLYYKNRRRRGLRQWQVKTFFRQSKLIDMLLVELRVSLMAKNFRYFKKNHLGNICVPTGFCFSLLAFTLPWAE